MQIDLFLQPDSRSSSNKVHCTRHKPSYTLVFVCCWRDGVQIQFFNKVAFQHPRCSLIHAHANISNPREAPRGLRTKCVRTSENQLLPERPEITWSPRSHWGDTSDLHASTIRAKRTPTPFTTTHYTQMCRCITGYYLVRSRTVKSCCIPHPKRLVRASGTDSGRQAPAAPAAQP